MTDAIECECGAFLVDGRCGYCEINTAGLTGDQWSDLLHAQELAEAAHHWRRCLFAEPAELAGRRVVINARPGATLAGVLVGMLTSGYWEDHLLGSAVVAFEDGTCGLYHPSQVRLDDDDERNERNDQEDQNQA